MVNIEMIILLEIEKTEARIGFVQQPCRLYLRFCFWTFSVAVLVVSGNYLSDTTIKTAEELTS